MALKGDSEIYIDFTVTTEYSYTGTLADFAKLAGVTQKDVKNFIIEGDEFEIEDVDKLIAESDEQDLTIELTGGDSDDEG